jgi:hypothetical protein
MGADLGLLVAAMSLLLSCCTAALLHNCAVKPFSMLGYWQKALALVH